MKRLALLFAFSALLLPANLALGAALPKPTTNLVVVPKSIGGVRLGMPEAKARMAWGSKRGSYQDYGNGSGRCEYGSPADGRGYAYIEFLEHKVSKVMVSAGTRKDGSLTTSAARSLMILKDKNGNGIGSKLAKLRSSYPKGKDVGKPADGSFEYTIKGRGKSSMSFGLVGSSKRVYSIFLTDGHGG